MACLIKFEEWLIRTEYYIVRGTWNVSVFHMRCSKHWQIGCAQKNCELLVNYLPKQWIRVYSDYSNPFVSESNQVTLMDTSQCHLPLNLVIILLSFAYISQLKANEGLKFLLELRHFISTSAWGHSFQDNTPSGDVTRKGFSVFIHKPDTSTLHDRWLYLCAFINWSLATASKHCPNRICTGGLLWSNVGPFNRATAVLVSLVLWHMILKEEDVRSFCRMICQLALVARFRVADSMRAFSFSEYLMNSESSSKQLLSQNPSVLQVLH